MKLYYDYPPDVERMLFRAPQARGIGQPNDLSVDSIDALLHTTLHSVPSPEAIDEDDPIHDTTFAFVHGYCHDESCWDYTRAELEHNGFETTAVRLSTDQAGTSFLTDAQEFIEHNRGRRHVVAVGHSQGFTPILFAQSLIERGIEDDLDAPQIDMLIGIAGAPGPDIIGQPLPGETVPDRANPHFSLSQDGIIREIGEHMTEIIGPEDIAAMRSDKLRRAKKELLQQVIQADFATGKTQPTRWLRRQLMKERLVWRELQPYERVIRLMLHDCSFEVQETALLSLRQHRRGGQEPPLDQLPEVEKHYIVCSRDRLIRPPYQRYVAQKIGAKTCELASGHSPEFAMPDRLAKLLIDIALGNNLDTPARSIELVNNSAYNSARYK